MLPALSVARTSKTCCALGDAVHAQRRRARRERRGVEAALERRAGLVGAERERLRWSSLVSAGGPLSIVVSGGSLSTFEAQRAAASRRRRRRRRRARSGTSSPASTWNVTTRPARPPGSWSAGATARPGAPARRARRAAVGGDVERGRRAAAVERAACRCRAPSRRTRSCAARRRRRGRARRPRRDAPASVPVAVAWLPPRQRLRAGEAVVGGRADLQPRAAAGAVVGRDRR